VSARSRGPRVRLLLRSARPNVPEHQHAQRPSVIKRACHPTGTTKDRMHRRSRPAVRPLAPPRVQSFLTLKRTHGGKVAPSSVPDGEWGILVAIFQTLIGIINALAFHTYARRPAIRIPNQWPAGHCRIVMCGLVTTSALIIVSMVLSVISMTGVAGGASGTSHGPFSPRRGSRGMGTEPWLMCAIWLAHFCFTSWAMLLLNRFRKVLGVVSRQAVAAWAAPVPLGRKDEGGRMRDDKFGG
jgi:hypothetical protein